MPTVPNKKLRKNHLKILCPDLVPSTAQIFLNGRRLRHIRSIKVEIPDADGFVRVSAEFYAILHFEATAKHLRKRGTRFQAD